MAGVPNPQRLDFEATAELRFDDPDVMAATMPGGTFGILPFNGQPFEGTVRATNLGDGVSARSVAFESPVLIRSRFIENASTISFLLPCIQGDVALLNGKEVDTRYLASSNGGVKHQFLTKGTHEVGAFTVDRDVLFDAIEILGKHSVPAYLDYDATILTDPRCTARLNALYVQVNDLLRALSRQNLSTFAGNGIAVLRDVVLAELVSSITEGQGKRDHLATWRRTEAMARVDRFVDEYADQVFSMERFCLETGMSLRTLEAIIKERTGLSALSYLRRRRLAMVRRTLLNPHNSTNVTRTALRYGFLHLGRFSVEYRRTYGETPSETLSRKLGNSLSSPQCR